MKRLCMFLCGVMVAACTTPMLTMPPGTEGYQIGYHDGCDAGYAYAGSPFYQRSNVTEPPRSVHDYADGWHAGFQRCAGSYQQIQRSINALLGPP
jgi:hypothetical protein